MRAKQYPVCLIVLLLLLSGCSLMGGTSKTVTQYVGTEGVTINFLKNAPPEEIYEDRPFPVKFELYNKGAHNVSYDRMIVTLSHDPLYIAGGMGRFDAKKLDLSATELLGRSPIYPQGEKKLYSIPTDASFVAKPVVGQRESPQTDLLASVCYAYKTFLSTEVCIDTNIYQQNERSQACAAKDLKFSGGQGAPIAITDIEVTSLPVISESGTESIRPQFIIRLQNVGGGYLIGPESLNMDRACIFNDIPKSELSTVRVTANLLKSRLVCGNTKNKTTEGLVRLENGEGEITCTVADNELNNPLYSSTQNFNTVLTVNVTYLYKASTKKTLSIQRFVGSSDRTPTGNENGKVSGYHYEGAELARDEAGRPITECSYLQAHPEEAPEPLQSRIKAVSPKTFSCSCTYDRCAKLGMGTNCFGGFCPGGSYCCTDPPPITSANGGLETKNVHPDESIVIPSIGPSPTKQQINDALEAAAGHYGIPASYLKAVAYKESTWNPAAVGDGGKSYGMMQIYTAAHPKYNLEAGKSDASYNIQYGAKLLSTLHKSSDGDWRTAIRKYNGAGPAAEAYADSVLSLSQQKPWTKFGITETAS